jgi:hypothetical protein
MTYFDQSRSAYVLTDGEGYPVLDGVGHQVTRPTRAEAEAAEARYRRGEEVTGEQWLAVRAVETRGNR